MVLRLLVTGCSARVRNEAMAFTLFIETGSLYVVLVVGALYVDHGGLTPH